MDKKKILSMIGLARGAGKLSMGNDMTGQSLQKGKAKCVLACEDISPRVVQKFENIIDQENMNVPILKTPFTMDEIQKAAGYRAGIFTVDDENFAKRIIELINQEEIAW